MVKNNNQRQIELLKVLAKGCKKHPALTQIKKHSNESAIPTIKVMNIGPLTSFRRAPLSLIKFDYLDLDKVSLQESYYNSNSLFLLS